MKLPLSECIFCTTRLGGRFKEVFALSLTAVTTPVASPYTIFIGGSPFIDFQWKGYFFKMKVALRMGDWDSGQGGTWQYIELLKLFYRLPHLHNFVLYWYFPSCLFVVCMHVCLCWLHLWINLCIFSFFHHRWKASVTVSHWISTP